MTDKELLELAAKAAAIEYGWQHIFDDYEGSTSEKFEWNPLTDDGDALRLAVKLRIDLVDAEDHVEASKYCFETARFLFESKCEGYRPDPYAATRRAIVRAAAEIGKNMK